jgi:hypothetical protein
MAFQGKTKRVQQQFPSPEELYLSSTLPRTTVRVRTGRVGGPIGLRNRMNEGRLGGFGAKSHLAGDPQPLRAGAAGIVWRGKASTGSGRVEIETRDRWPSH